MQEKCHQYWPTERSARYQYFVVDPMAEYNMPQYILREFKVTDARVSFIDQCYMKCFLIITIIGPITAILLGGGLDMCYALSARMLRSQSVSKTYGLVLLESCIVARECENV